MMGYLFCSFFMIPLMFFVNIFLLFQWFLVFMFFSFFFMYNSDFYCNLSYIFGLDYLSSGLIYLTFIIVGLMILYSSKILLNDYFFIFVNYLLILVVNMFFMCISLFYFYFFFEFSLIPLMFLIMGWGYQPERLVSSLYLFFYTLFGSLPLLLIILMIYFNSNSMFFDLIYLIHGGFMFHLFMVFAFLIKLPMFIFHFWLPSAHVQAPVYGSMILAGVFLKLGGYGLIRMIFISELLFFKYGYIWYSFSLYGSFLVSLICLVQGDLKCLIAYSSVSHMGLCLMGILTMSFWGVMGSYFMMLSHGLCSSCLFMISNFYYDRLHSRSFYINSGLISFIPSLTPFWFLFCCFNMGCPPSLNFLSEIMILNSMMMYFSFSYYFFLLISFFCSCFSFFLFSFVHQGIYHNYYSFSFISVREYLMVIIHLVPLTMIMLFLTIFY